MKKNILQSLQKKLIVSCQANEGEPLHGYPRICQALAEAAITGGAAGIRANYPENVSLIREITSLPVIGIYKKIYKESEVFITPTLQEVDSLVEAGADIIALDGTKRPRPQKQTLSDIIKKGKEQYPDLCFMADVSTEEEGKYCHDLGFDIIATTLSGYTPYSPQISGPDFKLVARLANRLSTPVIAEGRISKPEEARIMLEIGAWSVVVGGAITRPHTITQKFASALTAQSL